MFKNDFNQYLLRPLFFEIAIKLADEQKVTAPKFSLHQDRPGLINCRRTFVELEDPTGYKWAMRYLDGSYEHWTRLMETTWFAQAYAEWMQELTAKLKSRALDAAKALSLDEETPPAVRLQAIKYIHQLDKTSFSRGRPTQQEVTGEIKKSVREAQEVQEDMKRIGLKVV